VEGLRGGVQISVQVRRVSAKIPDSRANAPNRLMVAISASSNAPIGHEWSVRRRLRRARAPGLRRPDDDPPPPGRASPIW